MARPLRLIKSPVRRAERAAEIKADLAEATRQLTVLAAKCNAGINELAMLDRLSDETLADTFGFVHGAFKTLEKAKEALRGRILTADYTLCGSIFKVSQINETQSRLDVDAIRDAMSAHWIAQYSYNVTSRKLAVHRIDGDGAGRGRITPKEVA